MVPFLQWQILQTELPLNVWCETQRKYYIKRVLKNDLNYPIQNFLFLVKHWMYNYCYTMKIYITIWVITSTLKSVWYIFSTIFSKIHAYLRWYKTVHLNPDIPYDIKIFASTKISFAWHYSKDDMFKYVWYAIQN